MTAMLMATMFMEIKLEEFIVEMREDGEFVVEMRKDEFVVKVREDEVFDSSRRR